MVFAVPISVPARTVTTIIASVATLRTFVVTAFVAHVIAQRPTCATTCGRTHQTASITADATTDHVTACSAQTATDGRFCTVTTVRTHGRATCAAQASANRCTCIAAQLLADD